MTEIKWAEKLAYKVVYDCQGNAQLNSQDKFRVERFTEALLEAERRGYQRAIEDAISSIMKMPPRLTPADCAEAIKKYEGD